MKKEHHPKHASHQHASQQHASQQHSRLRPISIFNKVDINVQPKQVDNKKEDGISNCFKSLFQALKK